MKHLYFMLLMLFAAVCQTTYATETEPNNTPAQANILALNGTDSGKINPAGEVDWWKITTGADGKLNITLSNLSGKSMSFFLYDNNSSTLLVSGTSTNTFVKSRDGLAAGTYYIKVKCDSAGDTAKYALSNSLALPVQANDAEPNDSKNQALSLALNNSTTGHVGYYYKKRRDTADWYSVATNKDGRLDLSLTPVNGTNTLIYLYDNDGTTLLSSKNSNVTFTLSADGLATGTYFIKIVCTVSSTFTPYTLSNNLVTPDQAIDPEPNGTISQAVNLPLNSTKSGHVGYYYNNKRDTTDWYKITTNQDGKLNLKLTPVNGSSVWVYLFDNDGTTILTAKNSSTAFTVNKDGLAAGTYFLKINCLNKAQFTPYILSNKLDTLIQAGDTEPNNTKAEAATLILNGTQTGHAGYYYNSKRDTADWYKLTTTKDGKLDFTLTPVNGVDLSIYLYDNNGTTLLNSSDSNIAFTLSRDDLAAGTYFLKISCTDNSQFTAYLLTNKLTVPGEGNDAEPNNSKSEAVTLTINTSKTGHVGYYYKNKRDTSDWYKIITKVDTKLKLKLKLSPVTKQSVTVSLYANNGTSLINSFSGNSSFSLTTDGLEDDIYYVKINGKTAGDFAPYTLTDSVFAPPTTDTLILPLNFRIRDTLQTNGDVDWYKVTTNADGKLKLTLTPLSGKYVWLYLYDHNGTTLLNSSYSSGIFNLNTDGLAAGTYYVKVFAYYASDTTSYLLADSLILNSQANDKEPNNNRDQALTLNVNSSKTGNVGYLYNNIRDTADWYKITTKANGRLDLKLTSANGTYIYLYLYDNDGTTLLNSSYSFSSFTKSTDGLAAGTYYVKVNCYYTYNFSPYTLSNQLVTPKQANDAEPNDLPAQALTLNLNDSVTGHAGYYYNNKRDTTDWYKITLNANGLLKLNLTPVNGSYLFVYLYDNDGTTLLNSGYSSGPFTKSTDGLGAGTYYVKVNCYYTYGFTPYILSDSLIAPAQANDIEPNNTRAQAHALAVNSTTTGGVGYYYNNKRDTADWYKVTTTKDGLLRLMLTPVNGSYLYVNVYDNNGTLQLNSSYSSGSFVLNTDGLAAGTYYLKVNCYYNNNFTPYILTDSLLTYQYANDAEPNKRPYQGKNIAPNSTVTGHVNFYYNLAKDSLDWWKLNYNGNGNLQFIFNLAPVKINGTIPFTWFYVYKDTLSQPVYASYFNTASNTISLTSLSKGNYYIKINTYYQADFVTYSFSNSFAAGASIFANASKSSAIEEKRVITDYNVSLYPNPVSNRLHIVLSDKHPNLASVILRDGNGKQVWSKSNSTNVSGNGSMDVNVRNFPGGIYFLQLVDVNGKSITKKIIIVK